MKNSELIRLVMLAGAASLAGCRGDHSDDPPRQYFPDLDDQPKVKAQSRSTFFHEYQQKDTDRLAKEGDWYGRAMREPVANTIPYGYTTDADRLWDKVDFGRRAEMLKADVDFYEGGRVVLDAAGKPVVGADGQTQMKYLEFMPVTVDEELIKLGKKKYDIYCIVCHGGTGEGNGMVGQRWSYALPNYNDPKYFHGGEKGQDGYLFHTIRYGVPNLAGVATMPFKMPPYASKVTERESWAIVSYIRVLQATRQGTLADVPPGERAKLEHLRDTEAVGAPKGPGTSTPPGGAAAPGSGGAK